MSRSELTEQKKKSELISVDPKEKKKLGRT